MGELMIILDRFEGEYALIEIHGEIVRLEKHRVNESVREGDVLTLIDGLYYTDQEATEKRKQYIKSRFKDMWED